MAFFGCRHLLLLFCHFVVVVVFFSSFSFFILFRLFSLLLLVSWYLFVWFLALIQDAKGNVWLKHWHEATWESTVTMDGCLNWLVNLSTKKRLDNLNDILSSSGDQIWPYIFIREEKIKRIDGEKKTKHQQIQYTSDAKQQTPPPKIIHGMFYGWSASISLIMGRNLTHTPSVKLLLKATINDKWQLHLQQLTFLFLLQIIYTQKIGVARRRGRIGAMEPGMGWIGYLTLFTITMWWFWTLTVVIYFKNQINGIASMNLWCAWQDSKHHTYTHKHTLSHIHIKSTQNMNNGILSVLQSTIVSAATYKRC